jgi:HAD superfamily hydrolase (TIGR01549 family)
MSGGLLVNGLLRETGHCVSAKQASQIDDWHAEAYARMAGELRPLLGTLDLLNCLCEAGLPWAIATSGRMVTARPALNILGLDSKAPVITRDQVEHAKPDPDLFIVASQQLQVDVSDSIVIGDSVWDILAARRAGALPVGLLSGGYGQEELERAGAYRVYQDPADLLVHLDEVGVRI